MTEVAPSLQVPVILTEEKNPRGIPAAVFIEDVEAFLGSCTVEVTLGVFNELYAKYKYMEASFEKKKEIFKSKIPEIDQTLELIRILKHKKEEAEDMLTVCGLKYPLSCFHGDLIITFCRIILFRILFTRKQRWMWRRTRSSSG